MRYDNAMDPVTQGLLGAAVSQSVLHRRLRSGAWLVGGLAGMAPDLDILIRSSSDPMLFYKYHRHFTHALAFIPIGGLLVGAGLLLIRPALRQQWVWVLLAAILGYATHGLLDACTSYGTVLYWPFSEARVAWDSISIIDPVFTTLLMCGVLWTAVNPSPFSARLFLVLALCYLGFGFWQHHRALQLQAKFAQSRGQTLTRGRVMATIGNLYHWRSFYIAGDKIMLDTISTPPFSAASVYAGISVPLFRPADLPKRYRQSLTLKQDYETFSWFADGYVSALSKQPLVLGDARYIFSYRPVTALWGIEFPQDLTKQHIIWRSVVR